MDIRERMTDKAGDTYWDYWSHIKKKNKQTKKTDEPFFLENSFLHFCADKAHIILFQFLGIFKFSHACIFRLVNYLNKSKMTTWNLYRFGKGWMIRIMKIERIQENDTGVHEFGKYSR